MFWPICSQCTLSLPPENIRKPWFSGIFKGQRKGALGTNGLIWKKKLILNDRCTIMQDEYFCYFIINPLQASVQLSFSCCKVFCNITIILELFNWLAAHIICPLKCCTISEIIKVKRNNGLKQVKISSANTNIKEMLWIIRLDSFVRNIH